jgi:hypothetical protein
MNIKRTDDKPMVIHTKERTKIHAVSPSKISTAENSIHTVTKDPRQCSQSEHNNNAKATAPNRNKAKTKENKAPAKATENKANANNTNTPSANNINAKTAAADNTATNKNTATNNIPTTKTPDTPPTNPQYHRPTSLHTAIMVGKGTLNQVEGGREVNEAVYTASAVAAPVIGAAIAGRKLFISKTAKEKAEKRIKRTDGKRPSAIKRADAPNHETQTAETRSGKNTNNRSHDKTSRPQTKPSPSAPARESYKKEYSKSKTKNKTTRPYSSETGSRTKPLPPSSNQQSNRASSKTDSKPNANNSGKKQNKGKPSSHKAVRNRMIALFVSKLRQDSDDSALKAIKDLAMMRFTALMKKAAAHALLYLAIALAVIALVSLPVAAVITVIYNSPFAIFFPSNSSTSETAQSVLAGYVAEFNEKVEDEAESYAGCDYSEIVYDGYEGAGIPDNYIDILAAYMVRHGIGDTATDMTATAKSNLKAVFDDMCSYEISYGEVTVLVEVEATDEEGNIITEWEERTYRVKFVNVTLKTGHDMIPAYGFDDDQTEMLLEIMNPEYLGYIGYTPIGGASLALTSEQYSALVNSVSDPKARQALAYALSKVGYPYSQALRDSGTHYDCSSFSYYAWKSAGVSLIYEGSNTAASQGKYCYENNLTVSLDDIKPGDLIFYSFTKNGRFQNISHVAIYAGNGMVVEAANSSLGVVCRAIYSTGKIVFIGRPS